MTRLAQVPIEPLVQTQLLDACLDIPGVLIAGVPGAGGYDAVFCITLGSNATNKLFEFWKTSGLCRPLLCRLDSTGMKLENRENIL